MNDEDDVKYCSVCGTKLSPSEYDEDICDNCKCNILIDDDIFPNIGGF